MRNREEGDLRMTYDELFQLIKKRHLYVHRPSEEELNNVVNDLTDIYCKKGFVSNKDLDLVLHKNIINQQVILNNSKNLAYEINIAQQILDKLLQG